MHYLFLPLGNSAATANKATIPLSNMLGVKSIGVGGSVGGVITGGLTGSGGGGGNPAGGVTDGGTSSCSSSLNC